MTSKTLSQRLQDLENMLYEERHYNIWTIRLSPKEKRYPCKCTDCDKCQQVNALWGTAGHTVASYIKMMFSNLSLEDCPFYVIYSESKKGNYYEPDHFHARFVHKKWGTVANLYRWIKDYFPNETGNALYATKRVHVQGKTYSSISKSMTYTVKGRVRLDSRGYDCTTLSISEKIGAEWKEVKKTEPIYKQVIKLNSIHERTHGIHVVRAVLSYYEKANKPPPTYHQLQRILHNIKFCVDPKYREIFSEKSVSWYDHGCFDV